VLKRGVWFTGGQTVDEVVKIARDMEHGGIDAVWVADGYYGRDPFVTLAAIASATDRVELGTGVANPHLRHPTILATSFATLDEMSDGRAICGIGNGSRDQLAELGLACASPLGAMREAAGVLDALLSGGGIEHDGSYFSAHVKRLAFRLRRPHLPLVLAAVGPKMCALAGELADGVFLQYGSPEFIANSRIAVEAGFANRSESPDDYTFAVATVMSVSEDGREAEATDRVRATVGRLLTEPNAEELLEKNGLDRGIAQRIRVGLAERGTRGMAESVTDDAVHCLAVTGNVEQCRRQLQAVVDAGANHVAVTVRSGEVELTLAALEGLHG
jgi:5,10-methylenetetrahydromethanopterin reductase